MILSRIFFVFCKTVQSFDQTACKICRPQPIEKAFRNITILKTTIYVNYAVLQESECNEDSSNVYVFNVSLLIIQNESEQLKSVHQYFFKFSFLTYLDALVKNVSLAHK